MTNPWLHRLALAGLALVLGLQLWALEAHSLTGDGSHHLVAGYQALRHGRNTANLEHPPLAKLVMSLPMLVGPTRDEITARGAHRAADELYLDPHLLSITRNGRLAVLLVFVGPWLFAAFGLARRLALGNGASGEEAARAGTLLVLFLGLSLSVLPYLTILQTDVAVSLAFLLTALAGLRYLDRPDTLRAGGLGLALGLGLASKFSAVLLLPVVALVWWRARGSIPKGLRFGWLSQGLVVAVVAGTLLHGVYAVANWDYDRQVGREVIQQYCRGEGTVIVEDRLERWEPALLALEKYDPWLSQWVTGFLGVRAQNSIGVYASYAFGEVRSDGRWWYFPALLLAKTPLVLLVVGLGWLVFGRRGRFREWIRPAMWPVSAAAGLYLLFAVTSSYNLGVRHLLPVMPFLFLPLAGVLARRPRPAVLVVGLLALESIALGPLWMSATSTWFLGSANPTRWSFAAGNLEYRQNFRILANKLDERGIDQVGVLFPTLPPTVLAGYLPEARLVLPDTELEPGWYVVDVMVEQLVPAVLEADPGALYDGERLRHAAESYEPVWSDLRAGEDHGWVAGTFHLYRRSSDS